MKKKEIPSIEPDLMSEFLQAEKTTAEFTPENDSENENENTAENKTNETILPTFEQQIKIKMFAGLLFYVLSGFNTFVLNKIRKTKVPFEKMVLNDTETDSMLPYLNSAECLNFIDKLPTWLIGVIHYEYIMFQKHSNFVDEFKIKIIEKEEDIKK